MFVLIHCGMDVRNCVAVGPALVSLGTRRSVLARVTLHANPAGAALSCALVIMKGHLLKTDMQ